MRQQTWWQKKLLIHGSITGSITILICFIRFLGGFEGLELFIYDRMFTQKAVALWDERVVIVGFDNDDQKKYGYYPTDALITEALIKIQKGDPTSVGLSFTREAAPYYSQEREALEEQILLMEQCIETIIKINPETGNPIKKKQKKEDCEPTLIRASSKDGFPFEPDNITRKTQLYRDNSTSNRQFNWEIAYNYLTKKGVVIHEPDSFFQPIKITYSPEKVTKIYPLSGLRDGGYSLSNNYLNFQVLISWIKQHKLSYEYYSFETIINNPPPNFKDKIVLLGGMAESHKNGFEVPLFRGKETYTQRYYTEISGIIISNLLNQAETPFLQVWSDELEYLYFFFWMILSGTAVLVLGSLVENLSNKQVILLAGIFGLLGVTNLGVYWLSFLAFPYYWIPSGLILVGVTTNIVLNGMGSFVWQIFQEQQKVLKQRQIALNSQKIALKEKNQRIKQQQDKLREIQELKEQQAREIEYLKQNIIAHERLVFLGRLNTGFNHEIKNILFQIKEAANTSKSLVNHLGQKPQNEPQDEDKEIIDLITGNLQVISTQTKRCQGFRTKLLPDDFDFNKPLIPELVDLGELLNECIKLVFHSKQLHGNVKIEREYLLGLYFVEADPSELTFIFISLLNNAWDAMEKKLENQEYTPTVKLSIQDDDSHYKVQISDNGIPIPKTQESKIFLFFFTTKPPGQGTGVGLSLAKDILTVRYQGKIDLKQERGEKTFIVSLTKHQ